MAYRDTTKTLPQIPLELNVDTIVEGSVARSGQRVRIRAQLIKASTDTPLWANDFDRDLRDMLTLQGEIARVIATQIKAKLTPEERVRLSTARAVDPQTHEAYLKGRFYWNKRPLGISTGIEYFQQAIAIDPTYAAPYAGLADSYATLGSWENGTLPPKEEFEKAKAAASRALELDPKLSDAHNSLAYTHLHYDWDWRASEKEFRTAIELNPGSTDALHWYSHLLTAMGRHEDSLATTNQGLQLSPLDPTLNFHLAWAHYSLASPHRASLNPKKESGSISILSGSISFWAGVTSRKECTRRRSRRSRKLSSGRRRVRSRSGCWRTRAPSADVPPKPGDCWRTSSSTHGRSTSLRTKSAWSLWVSVRRIGPSSGLRRRTRSGRAGWPISGWILDRPCPLRSAIRGSVAPRRLFSLGVVGLACTPRLRASGWRRESCDLRDEVEALLLGEVVAGKDLRDVRDAHALG